MEKQEHQPAEDQAEPEGLLYHYTNQRGLLGILESKSIWATHLRYLNDTSEGQIVTQVVLDELNSRVNSDSMMQFFGLPLVEPAAKVKCDDEEIFGQGIAISSWVTSQDVFVTSFSEKGNLLSQWRAYSDASGGYSIGFSRSYLRAAGIRFLQNRQGRFYRDSDPLIGCRYYDEEEEGRLKKDVENLVTSYINEASSTKRSAVETGFNTPGAIALKYFLSLGTRSAITKDKTFREEAEWRLAFHLNRTDTHSDLEFRTGRSMLTPYFEVPLQWEGQAIDIKEIVVGPCPHRGEAMESIKMLLKKNGIRGIEVRDSQIPYRNW